MLLDERRNYSISTSIKFQTKQFITFSVYLHTYHIQCHMGIESSISQLDNKKKIFIVNIIYELTIIIVIK